MQTLLICRPAIVLSVFLALLTITTEVTRGEKINGDHLFSLDHLREIHIEIAAKDWSKLCGQSRTFDRDFNDKPYTYVKANVSIDGRRIESVGIRKKGFLGSNDAERPSLKIKFDEYVKQNPVTGLSRLTLNNNRQDTAQVSQLLTYQVFNAAGLAAPRCSLARVTVNGEYLGIYSHVESIKKPFLQRAFGDSTGNLYEGTIADVYPRSVDGIEAKSKKAGADRAKLMRLAKLLAAQDLDLPEINKLVDIDRFLRFWAVESLIAFWDGYSGNQNNFYVYDNPKDGRLCFIPWGADGCFTSFQRPFGRRAQMPATTTVYSQSVLANRLFHAPGIPDRYRRVLLGLLDEVWDEDKLVAQIDRVEKLISGHLHGRQSNASRAMARMREFIRSRRQVILGELKDWPPTVHAAPRKPRYTVKVGSARGTFSTQWRAAGTDQTDPRGEAKVQLTLAGKLLDVRQLTVIAQPGRIRRRRGGVAQRPPERPATVVLSGLQGADSQRFSLTLSVDRDAFSTGKGKVVSARGSFSENDAESSVGFRLRGGRSLRGSIRLTKNGTNHGDPVAGEFEVDVVESRGGFAGGERIKVPRSKRSIQRRDRLKQAIVLLKKLDKNQDGKIQLQEWTKGNASFGKADANSDNHVSLKELIGWLKEN